MKNIKYFQLRIQHQLTKAISVTRQQRNKKKQQWENNQKIHTFPKKMRSAKAKNPLDEKNHCKD